MKFSSQYIKFFLIIVTFSLLFVIRINAQIYGLSFLGQDANKDSRTGLNLNSEGAFNFSKEFELSFDISFNPDKLDYFGYVVRIIMDDNKNFDLIRDVSHLSKKDFCVVAGSQLTSIRFNLSKEALVKDWRTFKIKFDLSNDQILFFVGNSVFVQKKAGLKENASFRFMFGACNFPLFKTIDVPPMRLKNIRIRRKQKDIYFWPLNEMDGNTAIDQISGKKAYIANPQWVAPSYFNWKKIAQFSLNGLAHVAFDPKKEVLYLIGSNSFISYNVHDRTSERLKYPGSNILNLNGQSFYDPITQKLYNYSIDEKNVSFFDFNQKHWVGGKGNFINETSYWHHNKIVSQYDSSLYLFGGYGHHKYKNLVQKLNYRSNEWKIVKTSGDYFNPRYLAAAGKNETGDTIYLIGGYGSRSGEQILNPMNYYDLMVYSVKNKTFKKIYDFRPISGDFCFANSLYIDYNTNQFYGLTFSQNEFNCNLQLLEGSLEKPKFQLVGDKIPFKFYDVKSFADLYYCPNSKVLLAVTIYCNDQNISELKVYTIKYPPNALGKNNFYSKRIYTKIIFWVLVVGFLSLLLYFLRHIFFKKNRKVEEEVISIKGEDKEIPKVPLIIAQEETIDDEYTQPIYKNAILLFGDLLVFNKEGVDITRKFSPLLRELFLLILLYSLRHSKGISVEKLDEILWFDKDEKSARNNRAVNIAKLKELLSELEGCQLTNNGGYWKLKSDSNSLYIDYQKVRDLIKENQTFEKKEILVLIRYVKNGALLTNFSYEWLDDFKSQISNDLIDILLKQLTVVNLTSDPNFIIQITDAVFQFDAVNEEAMVLKCKALIALGKHSLAKQIYTRFVNEYKLLYNVEYKNSFNIISTGQIPYSS